MAFISLKFIIFIAVVVLVYFLVPKKARWFVLLTASYTFYFISSRYLILILFSGTLITFLTAKAMDRIEQDGQKHIKELELKSKEKKAYKEQIKKRKKAVLTIGIILVLGTLIFLKYYNFFASSVNTVSHVERGLPILNLLLPLGISFYTLQAIAYMIDIYRNKYRADTNLPQFMLFMSFFPQIVQGPIARHDHLAHQLYEGHDFDYKRMTFGVQLIMWGFFKKLVIADRLNIMTSIIFTEYRNYHGMMIFLATAAYGIQVYADFSGGVDIARGFAQIVGIELEPNFNQPYFATSIEDFWRRWHMTLGHWMRDYIFYPLALSKAFTNLSKRSRKIFGQFIGKRLPSFLAMFIVYLLVGIWHGAEWKFIAYGIWNGVFIMASILLVDAYAGAKKRLRINDQSFGWRLFQMVRTFVIISVGRIISKAVSLGAALFMLRSMTDRWYELSFITDGSLLQLGLDNANVILILFCIAILLVVDLLHEKGYHIRESISRQFIVFRWALFLAVLVCILVMGVWGPNYDAASFIYGRF